MVLDKGLTFVCFISLLIPEPEQAISSPFGRETGSQGSDCQRSDSSGPPAPRQAQNVEAALEQRYETGTALMRETNQRSIGHHACWGLTHLTVYLL
ncbi:hypothetical protein AAFF_G00247650 [Aldrovandia affinis]|uniref:Uncharacterized protein n=1 Tax=Aldrovandia affinis TaxID=143900 RepID=A0AAD7W441_9TELE|nr:hypothetical protein AAFF_G00247650 [Aldrovandia affinis]